MLSTAGSFDLAAQEYTLQVQGAFLRTMDAVARAENAPVLEAAGSRIQHELHGIERELARLPITTERPMTALAQRFEWSRYEVDFVWTSVALATEPRMLAQARALDEHAVRGLSPSLYSRIARLDAIGAHALGLALLPDRPMTRTGLLLPSAGEWVPASVPWVPVPELVRHLVGEPTSHAGIVEVTPPIALVIDDAQRAALEQIRTILTTKRRVALVVEGPDDSGRRTAISLATDRSVFSLDLARIDLSPASLDAALVSLFREAALRGAVAIVAGIDELVSPDAAGLRRVLARHLERTDGPVALVSNRRGLDIGANLPAIRIVWPAPDVAARRELWSVLAGGSSTHDGYDLLADRFRLGAGAIRRAVASARVLSHRSEDDGLTAAELQAGVRQNISERMSGLAEHVIVKQSWGDLVLADDVMAQVRALVGRVEHAHMVYEQWGYRTKMPRGTGVAAMFSGPPGTGKTMAAGLIARELDLELYQVDLSKVVSKWVGETEKQLSRVFDAAEDGHALLLFDEADSLFGQRSSEMKSATDRYANLEVNFLLQRIESFGGVVILTTNLDASVDKALKRRLAAHVVFQHPDDDEREQLWTRMLGGEAAPLGHDIDVRKLARQFPKMTGANIRNAALAAAFLAAAQQRAKIDHATIVQAARSEYLSMGHVLTTDSGL